MRIVFRVEGEPNIGLGHIMRCMALAQRLDSFEHEVFFFMSSRSQSFCRNRSDWPGQIILIPQIDTIQEPKWIMSHCIDLRADWLVLDGYQFNQDYRFSLQTEEFKLAVFDDLNNSGALHADMVINGALNAGLHDYKSTASNALLAIGPNYQVLRQEFLQLTDKDWLNRKSLTLMFGGSDPKNVTLKALHSLQQSHASMPITVITGAAYSCLKALTEFIQLSPMQVTHLHDCQNMAEILVTTKLALSAAGSSQFELLACATPSVLIVVAENQKKASADAASQGWCQVVHNNDLSIDKLVSKCLLLWKETELLHAMHQKAIRLPVLNGAKNITELMSEQNINSDTRS